MNRILTILLGLVVATTLSLAQPDDVPRRMMERRVEIREDMADKLNLTDEQKKQMQKLHLDMQKKMTQHAAKIRTAGLELKELFLADKLDRSAIEKAIKNVADLRQQAALNRLDHWYTVNAILDPDQQKVWKEHLSNIVAEPGLKRMRGMRHRGPGGMGFRGGRW